MYKAEFSIKLFTIAGVWRPIGWSFIVTKTLYNIYTVLVIFLFYSFDISLCLYLILHSLNDIDEFAESLCWFLAALVTCVKMTNFLLRRNDIIKLINILNKDCLKTRDTTETMIQDKSDFTARRNTKYFFVITCTTAMAMIFGGLAKGKDISLPLKASFPYDYNQKLLFYLTYVSQSMCLYSAGLITVASETFVMTMLIQICSQLDIIFYRLKSLPNLHKNNKKSGITFTAIEEAKIIKDCIVHHNYIYMFSNKLNDIFNIVFGIQFFGSVLNICTLVFSLSTKNEINDKVVVQSIALTNFLFQIFMYCHFGNAVMLKSLNLANVLKMMDWTILTKNTKHGLLLISVRARNAIILTSGSVIPMTYDTFLTILRASYGAYNLLQNSNA